MDNETNSKMGNHRLASPMQLERGECCLHCAHSLLTVHKHLLCMLRGSSEYMPTSREAVCDFFEPRREDNDRG